MKSSLLSRVLRLAFAVVLALGLMVPVAHAQFSKKIVVIDRSSQPIQELYSTPTGDPDWGHDLLGSGIIGVNRYRIIDVEDGSPTCFYDFKAVMADGQEAFHYHVNACAVDEWTITD